MTSWVTLDSGVLLTAVFSEPLTEKAVELLRAIDSSGTEIVVPTLFQYEVTAVIRKHVFRQRIEIEEAREARRRILRRAMKSVFSPALLTRAFELANEYNLPTAYDAQYLAVSERYGSEFWTTDQRLYNALAARLDRIRFLGDFTPPSRG